MFTLLGTRHVLLYILDFDRVHVQPSYRSLKSQHCLVTCVRSMSDHDLHEGDIYQQSMYEPSQLGS